MRQVGPAASTFLKRLAGVADESATARRQLCLRIKMRDVSMAAWPEVTFHVRAFTLLLAHNVGKADLIKLTVRSDTSVPLDGHLA